MPLRPITSQTSYMVALATGNRMVRISGVPFGFIARRAVGLDDLDMGAEPVRLARAAGEIPARGDRDSRRGPTCTSWAIAPQARMPGGVLKISCAASASR